MDIVKLSTRVLHFSSNGASSVLTCNLVLTNTATTDIAFALRSSNELHYRARPSLGVIPQGQSLSILFYRKPTRTAPSVGVSRDSFTLCVAAAPDGVAAAMSPQRSWQGVHKLELKVEFMRHSRNRSASSSSSRGSALTAPPTYSANGSGDQSLNTGLMSDVRVLRFAPASLDGRSVVCDTIRIANISGRDLAFNVHSTSTQRFRVFPSSGIIPKDQSRYVIFCFEAKRSVPRSGRWEDMFVLCLAQVPDVGHRRVPTDYWSSRKDAQVFGMLLYTEFAAIRSREVSESVPMGTRRSPVARLWPAVSPIPTDRRVETSDSLRIASMNKESDIVRLDKKVVSIGPYLLKNETLFCAVLRISNVSKSDVAFCLRTGDNARVSTRPDTGVIRRGQTQVVLFNTKPPWTFSGSGGSHESILLYVTEAAGMATVGLVRDYWTSTRRNDVDVANMSIKVECSRDPPAMMYSLSSDGSGAGDIQGLLKQASKEARSVRRRGSRRWLGS